MKAKRYFEFVNDKSSKFWEVSVKGKYLTIRFGKISTDGQTSIKEFRTHAEAKAQADKLVINKMEKGYIINDIKKNVRKYKKNIYIKTEPGGSIVFGKIDLKFEKIIKNSIKNKLMNDEIFDLKTNDSFLNFEGVINTGVSGQTGNIGKIVYDNDGPLEFPKDNKGNLLNGFYLIWISLSKVSVEFEFETNDNLQFNKNKFTERSVRINLPEFIQHDGYGPIKFNIVTGYLYNNIFIDEYYDSELIDRGYDSTFMIVRVEKYIPQLVYKNINGNEYWI